MESLAKVSISFGINVVDSDMEYFVAGSETNNIGARTFVRFAGAGCEIRLRKSRIANRFWETANRNYQFPRKLQIKFL